MQPNQISIFLESIFKILIRRSWNLTQSRAFRNLTHPQNYWRNFWLPRGSLSYWLAALPLQSYFLHGKCVSGIKKALKIYLPLLNYSPSWGQQLSIPAVNIVAKPYFSLESVCQNLLPAECKSFSIALLKSSHTCVFAPVTSKAALHLTCRKLSAASCVLTKEGLLLQGYGYCTTAVHHRVWAPTTFSTTALHICLSNGDVELLL